MEYNIFRDMLEDWTEDEWIKTEMFILHESTCLIGRHLFVTQDKDWSKMVYLYPNKEDHGYAALTSNKVIQDTLINVISEQYPERSYNNSGESDWGIITSFNDSPFTEFEDVQLVLEKAANRLDEMI